MHIVLVDQCILYRVNCINCITTRRVVMSSEAVFTYYETWYTVIRKHLCNTFIHRQ